MKDQAASLVLKVVHTRNALETSQYPSKSKTPTLAKKWNAVLKQYIRKVPKEVKTQRLPLHTHLDIVSKNTSEYPAHITENVCVCVGSPALGLVLYLVMVVNSVYLRP